MSPRQRPNLISRTLRAWTFARHIPPHKILRRLTLIARRVLSDLVPYLAAAYSAPPPAIAATPPMPFLPSRKTSLTIDGPNLRFTFNNAPRQTPRAAIDWHPHANQLWRMHLHYMEALESADDGHFASLVASWIANNKPSAKGAWRDAWSPYTVSIRSLVWMRQLSLRRTRLSPTLVASMESSLANQLRYLIRNLETDLGGNHLIKNITALIWASAYFAGPEPDRWRACALKLLTAELPRQILSDGVHYERSPSYHCQVFADLLDCRHILGSNASEPSLPALNEALDRMAQATANLTHPDGAVALFNDAGLTMAHAPAACLDAYASFGHARPAPSATFVHASAGYAGLHTAYTSLVVDCGRIAPDDLPAHGHADALSFELSIAGQRVIVDQGVYEYLAGPRRDAARATASHNTLCFENTSQADCYGAFRCGRRPNVKILGTAHIQVPELENASQKNPEFQEPQALSGGLAPKPPQATIKGLERKATPRLVLEATHDGFSHLAGRPIHVRRFDATPTSLTLTDTIGGKPTARATLALLLHPAARITPITNGVVIHQGPATLTLTSTLPVSVEPAVWWPDLGVEYPTHRLRLRFPPGTRLATTYFTWS